MSRDNPTSHFNPLADSMRIGFVLARFTMLSLGTAVLDNAVFSAAIHLGFAAALAQVAARAVAVLVNYPLARRAVFLSKEPHRSTLVRYLALVAASGLVSFQLLRLLQGLARMERAEREDRGGIGAVSGELRDPARLGIRAAAASRRRPIGISITARPRPRRI